MSDHGKLGYIEFPANDLEATKAFFTKTFDWAFMDYGRDYTTFSGYWLNGGFYKSDLKATTETGSALLVLYSKDLEAALNLVVENGGKIVKHIFSFPGGRRFHFTEPSGNECAVWSEVGGESSS